MSSINHITSANVIRRHNTYVNDSVIVTLELWENLKKWRFNADEIFCVYEASI